MGIKCNRRVEFFLWRMLAACSLLTRTILKHDCFLDEFGEVCKHSADLEEIISLDYLLDNLIRILDYNNCITQRLIVLLDMEEHDTLEALVEYVQQRILGDLQESRRRIIVIWIKRQIR